jgi:glycosyltransferase involved in cell wall biosynthesis
MHAGLIPVISYESGVDVDGFGSLLADSSVAEIQAAVRQISHLPVEALQRHSRAAWETARSKYTRENYARTYREIVGNLLQGRAQMRGAA